MSHRGKSITSQMTARVKADKMKKIKTKQHDLYIYISFRGVQHFCTVPARNAQHFCICMMHCIGSMVHGVKSSKEHKRNEQRWRERGRAGVGWGKLNSTCVCLPG